MNASHASNASNASSGSMANARRVALASTIGTIAEYYDFFAYGTAAALVFGKLFFPSADPLLGTVAAFASFAVGFIARPIGGMVFGHFGDKVGRKKALIVTILIVGLGTVCIGLLPTYAQAGWLAPAGLIAIRVLQGFGVGGEQAGAVLLTAEYAPSKRRGLMASLVQLGAPGGFLIPSALFAVLTHALTDEQFLAWGWRIPFLASSLLVMIGLYIRLRIDESPIFAKIRAAKEVESAPLLQVLRSFPGIVLRGLLAKLVESIAFTLYTMVVLVYGKSHGLDASLILQSIIVAVVLELPMILLAGWLSDRLGRRTVFIFGALMQFVLVYPFFAAVDTGNALMLHVAMICALSIAHAFCYAPQASMFPELFPARVRCSGIALIWQFGSLLGGGLFSVLSIKLIQMMHGSSAGIVAYLMIVSAISAIALYTLPETAPRRRKGEELHDWGSLELDDPRANDTFPTAAQPRRA